MYFFKHKKSHDILSFIIHWNVSQFVEAMIMMAQINIKE